MANPLSIREFPAPLHHIFEEVRSTAREQVRAAWLLQVEKITAELHSGWESSIDHILNERFTELTTLMEQRTSAASAQARGEVAEKLNLAARHLKNFENEEQWSRSLVSATAGFCERAALFTVNQGKLSLRAVRGLEMRPLNAVPLNSAPAFASVAESKDGVVALRTRGELSEAIAELVGEAPGARVHLFPMNAGNRIAGILYTDSDHSAIEPGALEVIAAYGSAVLGSLALDRRPGAPLKIFGTGNPAPETSRYTLSRAEQELHWRAQRFARVRVANLQLYNAQAVKSGRAEGNLYAYLKAGIDEGREAYRQTYLTGSNSMADYFHLELIRTLANENADLLGPDYPGPVA